MGWFTDSEVIAVGGTPSFNLGDLVAKDFEQITIDDTVGGIGLSTTKLANSGLICKAARCVAADADIVFREDGGAPTSDKGMLRANSSEFVITGYNQLVKFRAVRAGTVNATLNVTYYF